ncbi:unnamed protein product [Rotaria sp. Silwood1]|nr:unnamed protein product [Rotaria sp. Silwood1]CAF4797070.1 unnamed protein product [Rotaria sp. Silwood1]
MLKSVFWDGIWPATPRFGRRAYRKPNWADYMGVTITDGSVGQAQVGISTLATVMASWLIPEEFRDRAVENVKILIVAAIEGSYIAQAFTFNSQSDALLTTLLIVAKKIDSPTNPKLPVAAT